MHTRHRESKSLMEVQARTPGLVERGTPTPRRPTPAREVPCTPKRSVGLAPPTCRTREGTEVGQRLPLAGPSTTNTPVTTRGTEEGTDRRPRRTLKLPARLQDYELYRLELSDSLEQTDKNSHNAVSMAGPALTTTRVVSSDSMDEKKCSGGHSFPVRSDGPPAPLPKPSYRDILSRNLPAPALSKVRSLQMPPYVVGPGVSVTLEQEEEDCWAQKLEESVPVKADLLKEKAAILRRLSASGRWQRGGGAHRSTGPTERCESSKRDSGDDWRGMCGGRQPGRLIMWRTAAGKTKLVEDGSREYCVHMFVVALGWA